MIPAPAAAEKNTSIAAAPASRPGRRKGDGSMKKKIRRCIPGALPALAVLLLAACWAGGTAAYGAVPALNIPRMIQECPHFSDHPGSNGVIWLKDSEYSLGADGSMTRKTTLVVLARRGIDDRWTRWSIPVPEGGAAEVLSASLYDPGSGRILSPVLPEEGEVNGIAFTEVLFPDIRDEFIIVLSMREVFPKRFAVEDLLWVNETLPLWEQKVTVNVPAGMELYVASEGAGEPRREKAAGRETPVEHGEQFRLERADPQKRRSGLPFLQYPKGHGSPGAVPWRPGGHPCSPAAGGRCSPFSARPTGSRPERSLSAG